jgi:hypothetical protein
MQATCSLTPDPLDKGGWGVWRAMRGKQPAALDRGEAGATNYISGSASRYKVFCLWLCDFSESLSIVAINTHRVLVNMHMQRTHNFRNFFDSRHNNMRNLIYLNFTEIYYTCFFTLSSSVYMECVYLHFYFEKEEICANYINNEVSGYLHG